MFQQYEFVFCVLSSERNRSDIGFATETLPLVSKVKHNSGIGNARYPAASNESSVCVNPVHGSTTRVHCDIHSYSVHCNICFACGSEFQSQQPEIKNRTAAIPLCVFRSRIIILQLWSVVGGWLMGWRLPEI